MKVRAKAFILAAGMIVLAVFALGAKTASASALQKAPNNLGLVAYWSFEDATGTTATDFSGNGKTGTLSGQYSTTPRWVRGKIGGALKFPLGENTYVAVPTISIPTDITISAWIYSIDYASIGSDIVGKAPDNTQWSLFVYFGDIRLRGGDSSSDLVTPAPSPNVWHHIVGTISGTSGKIFIDGVNVASGPVTAINNGSGVVTIGAATGASYFDRGTVDELRIYNRALGATEVSALYNSGGARINASMNTRGPQNGLVGQWSFDGQDISGTTAYDRSGQGNNGTLTNNPSVAVGRFGQALSFTGSNYLSVTSLADAVFAGSWSQSLWIKTTVNSNLVITEKNDNNAFIQSVAAGEIRAGTTGAGGDYYDTTGAGINNDSWHLVTVTFNSLNKNLIIYIDGSTNVSATTTNNAISHVNPFVVGARNTGLFGFPGSIDDVRVYNRALTAAEVAQLYSIGTTKVNAPQNTRGPQSGLVGLWSFDGKDLSGVTAYDRSGQGNNGTLTNGPSVAVGKIGQALSFDGVDDYVNFGSGSLFNRGSGPYSLSAWVYPTNIAGFESAANFSVGNIIRSLDDSSGGAVGDFGLGVDNAGKVSFANWRSSSQFSGNVWTVNTAASTSTAIVNNNWYQITAVFDGSSNFIYINGALQPLSAVGDSGGGWQSYTTIGTTYTPSGAYYWNGKIDDVRVYNRALSASEVLQIYNLGK